MSELTPESQTRVMLVDDHEIMRDGLREVLERSGDFRVVGEAGDGNEAVTVALSVKPDVIIMDVMMPAKNGIEACREITAILPDTRVLVLTASRQEYAVIGSSRSRRDRVPPEVLGQRAVAAHRPGCRKWRIPNACRRHETRFRRSKGNVESNQRFNAGNVNPAGAGDTYTVQPGAVLL